MKAIWNILSSIIVVALTIWFIKWYVKGHFGKYFILFWLNTILAISMFINHKNNIPPYDPTPGYVYWNQNH